MSMRTAAISSSASVEEWNPPVSTSITTGRKPRKRRDIRAATLGPAGAGAAVSTTTVVVSTTKADSGPDADAHAVAALTTATVDSASLINIPSLRDAPKYLLSGAQRYQLVRAEPVRSRHIPRFLR